jgi:hypothetical protein
MDKVTIELTAQQWGLVLQSLDELPRKVSNTTWVDIYTQLKAHADAGKGPAEQ